MMVVTQRLPNDTLHYIAGYIAKKIKDKYPDLGNYTHQLLTEHQHNLLSWRVNKTHKFVAFKS
jgi:hypothetical protein